MKDTRMHEEAHTPALVCRVTYFHMLLYIKGPENFASHTFEI